MCGTFRALCVLSAALIQYSLWISASPVIHRKLELPNGFVAGPPLTREEFDTPITSLTRDGIVDPTNVPTCTILVPDWYGKNAITSSTLMWPNSRIPYVISESFNTAERQIIATAMNEYEKNTCITFVPRTEEVDYIVITADGSGCTSYVGRVGGAQTVSLDPGCVYTYIAIHELMHAAGFKHEQGRTDRDDYVDINWDNIQPGYEYAFDKYSSAYIQLLGTLYDYGEK